MKKQLEQNPLIISLLEQNRITQLIRMMLNHKTSQEYLTKYGQKSQSGFKKMEQQLIQNYSERYNIEQIIHLYGSEKCNVKYYCNTFISQCLKKKLKKGHHFKNQERRAAYIQLTEYYQLQNLYQGLYEIELPQQIIKTIDKDVQRTYISSQLHQNATKNEIIQLQQQMRKRLTQILSSIAKYNPYISYCQGMNTIILFFIEQKFTNKQIFFIFKKITQQLLPCDFYSSMDSTMAFVKILFEILHVTHQKIAKKMKNIIRHMESEDKFIVAMSFVFQWFICLFTNINLDRNIRLLIMDHFMLQGVTALFKSALAFFDVMEQSILKVTKIQDYMTEVQRTMRQFKNKEILSKRLNSYLSKSLLHLLKEKLVINMKITRLRQSKNNCNRKWNICLQATEDNLAFGNKNQFFVFKTNEEIKFIDNYFQKHQNQYFRIGKAKYKTDLLRLGRMAHTCRYNSEISKTNDQENKTENNSLIEYNSSEKREKVSPNGKKVSQFESKTEHNKVELQKQIIREKVLKKLESSLQNQRKSVFYRSQSMQFMKSMIQNESFSNLVQLLEIDEMEHIFQQHIEQND